MTETDARAPATDNTLETKLRALGKTTWNDRWSFLGEDFERGVENVAKAAQVEARHAARHVCNACRCGRPDPRPRCGQRTATPRRAAATRPGRGRLEHSQRHSGP